MLLKRLFMAVLLVCVMLLPAESAVVGASEEASPRAAAEAEPSPDPAQPEYDVELFVFLYDNCGGCGTDSPGCGNCQDIVRYHDIIKAQLGNRLYDGTILYRMNNCRIEASDRLYDAYYEAYGIPRALYGYLPTVFIGTPDGGVYLASEKMLDYVGAFLDKYLETDDLASLQLEIDAVRAELYAEQ